MDRHTSPAKSYTQTRFRLNSRLLPALVILLLLLQLAVPYRGWTALLAGLGGVWLVSYLWARSLARQLCFTREMRFGWAQVGDRLQERFTLTNGGWAPAIWAEVIDHSTLPDYKCDTVRHVSARNSTQWLSNGSCTRRGLFTLGPTTIRTGDPFGLYTVSLHNPDSMALMVTPPILNLPVVDVAAGGRLGGGPRSRAHSVDYTVSSSSVRGYVPGDSWRWIHWRMSAHKGDLLVRRFDTEPASDWWILLDLDRSVQLGEGPDSTEEHSVMLAASLADLGLRSGRAVGLVAHGQELVWLPPRGGDGQRMAILQALALASPGKRPLVDLVREDIVQPNSRQRPSLILITPAANGDWVESLFPLLRLGIIPTVLLLDPRSYGGTDDVSATVAFLTDLGVVHDVITRELFDRPEAHPGQRGHWEWRTYATGRAVPVRRPRDLTWKRLA
jgi:uncharacterized protein (DUF58 family)